MPAKTQSSAADRNPKIKPIVPAITVATPPSTLTTNSKTNISTQAITPPRILIAPQITARDSPSLSISPPMAANPAANPPLNHSVILLPQKARSANPSVTGTITGFIFLSPTYNKTRAATMAAIVPKTGPAAPNNPTRIPSLPIVAATPANHSIVPATAPINGTPNLSPKIAAAVIPIALATFVILSSAPGPNTSSNWPDMILFQLLLNSSAFTKA